MSETKGSPVTFKTGCAINKNMYYIASSPDAWTESEDAPYSLMFIYQDQTEEKWFYHELPGWEVISTCFPDPKPGEVRKAYALSEEGDVECYSREGTTIEKIHDAGLSADGPLYGYVSRIRKIGENFYVCGLGGQVYRRAGEAWEHFDEGLLQDSKNPSRVMQDLDSQEFSRYISGRIKHDLALDDINGAHEDDLYVVGMNGLIAHTAGNSWKRLNRVTGAHLNCIHIASPSEVWIVGSAGTILRGNANQGFEVISRKSMEWDFHSITSFNNDIYISGTDGIYRIRHDRADRLDVSDKFNLRDVSNIESKDGVLWALSPKKLLRFDGNEWECFEHPNNV